MKNSLDNAEGDVQPPPSKRIKLEEDSNDEQLLLTRKKHGRGRQRKLSKSTIEERALVLLNDDRISAVEPQQVLCRMCGHWVKLFKHTDYSPANWKTHADKCEPRSGWRSRIRADPAAIFTLTIPATLKSAASVPAAESVPSSLAPVPSSSSATSSSHTAELHNALEGKENSKGLLHGDAPPSTRRPIKSTSERRRELDNDPRCEKPGPHSVLCKMCGQSVRLHNTREYDLWNWLRHAEKCEVKYGWVESNTATSQVLNPGSANPGIGEKSVHSVECPTNLSPPDQSEPQDNDGHRAETMIVDEQESPIRINLTKRAHRHSDSPITSAFVPDYSSTDRSLRGSGMEETHRELGAEATEDGTDAAASFSSPEMRPSTSGTMAPIIKGEPTNKDELLHYAQRPAGAEEGASASASTSTKRRKGRSAEERKQALLNDPRIGQVQPNEVFCKMCNKWIKLYKEVDYVESNWTRHAERCSVRQAAKNAISAPRTQPAPIPPPASTPTKRSPVKSTAERLYDLQVDSRIEVVDPHQVLCRICKQWIKLQSYREYDIWNWRKHIPLCEQRHTGDNDGPSGPLSGLQPQAPVHSEPIRSFGTIKAEEFEIEPSSPAFMAHLTVPPKFSSSVKVKDESSTEERRAILERDGRCENIEPQRVTCKLCSRVVGLHMKKDYSLSNWYKHVASCAKTEKSSRPPIRTAAPAASVPGPAFICNGASSSAHVTATTASEAGEVPANEASLAQDADVQIVVSAPPHMDKTGKSTIEERRAKLLADPRVQAVEPGRVLCKLCQRWRKLNVFMDYAPYNWYKHIERCQLRFGSGPAVSSDPVVVKEEVPGVAEIKISDGPPVSANGGPRKRTTPAERLARMQADTRIKTIEKHRARCGLCDKWVKLQNKTEYDPHNWFTHIMKCAIRSDASPTTQTLVEPSIETREASSTVNGDSDTSPCMVDGVDSISNSTVLSRRALLLNDVRSAAVEPHRVLCGICHQWIKLRDGKEYVPYNWFKHKRKCEKRHALLQTNLTPSEHATSASVLIKESVKKEVLSVDLGLYNNDQRKMTDEEREAQLRADPRLGDVEPGRVFCKMCDSWIRLNMSTGFLRGNWLRHAQRCKGRVSWQGATPEFTEEPELSAFKVIDLETTGECHFGFIELGRLIGKFEPTISSTEYGNPPEVKPASEVVKQVPTWNMPTLRARPNSSRVNSPAPLSHAHSDSKVSDTGKRMHRSEEERKQELESDSRTKIVHPDKILCNMCDRWIQMRRDVSYSPQNWLKHAGICEQKTGWMKKYKSGYEIDIKLSQSGSQPVTVEFLPYNARVRAQEPPMDFNPPSLKPVDWSQTVCTDDDDDDELVAVDVPIPKADSDLAKGSPAGAPDQPSPTTKAGAETPNKNSTPNTTNVSKMSVPTSLSVVTASRGDLKAFPISLSTPMAARNPLSTPPPIVTPFTTVPLPFYRTAYSPHVVQYGVSEARDSVPPKSISPQNSGMQRSLPFVVPAPSMLPHLLPRPVLVPISQTSRHASGAASPYRYSATPPMPLVGLTKTKEALSTPPAVPTTLNGTNSIAAATTTTTPVSGSIADSAPAPPVSSEVAKATGVAVPTPVRSVLRHTTLAISAESGRASSSPTNHIDPSREPVPVPVTSEVAQLVPTLEISEVQTKDHNEASSVQADPESFPPTAETDIPLQKEMTATQDDAARKQIIPEVLQLGPRMDMPVKKQHRFEEAAPPAELKPGVLQLVPDNETFEKGTVKPKGQILRLEPCRKDEDTQRETPTPEECLESATNDKRHLTEPAPDAMLVEA